VRSQRSYRLLRALNLTAVGTRDDGCIALALHSAGGTEAGITIVDDGCDARDAVVVVTLLKRLERGQRSHYIFQGISARRAECLLYPSRKRDEVGFCGEAL
jgi:hypothetical protein